MPFHFGKFDLPKSWLSVPSKVSSYLPEATHFRYNREVSRETFIRRHIPNAIRLRRFPVVALALACGLSAGFGFLVVRAAAQGQESAPAASGARILLLPRKIVSGEHATLAVLDVNGRLTPGVRVNFSNGDRVTTDTTGRALFVAPLDPGKISAVIADHPGRVYITILGPTQASSEMLQVTGAPRVASLADRFELAGLKFCGDADANNVTVGGIPALVLASSPMSLVVLPPDKLPAGNTDVVVSCSKNVSEPFTIRFVELSLEANSSPLSPGDHRTLTVHVHGTPNKISLEARNLAPDIADLAGGNPARVSSSGGVENLARFQLVGKQRGNFVVSIRLLAPPAPPQPAAQP
jgi:hypothetical protein